MLRASNFENGNPLRRKGPVTKRPKKQKSFSQDPQQKTSGKGKSKRGNSLTIERQNNPDDQELQKVQLKITKSQSFTFENIEFYTKPNRCSEQKDFLEVPEDNNEEFFDAQTQLDGVDISSLKINYELPSDPFLRARWINGLRNHAAFGKVKITLPNLFYFNSKR